MNRREFFKLSAMAAMSQLLPAQSKISPTLEEAINDFSLRQQYLENLIDTEMPSMRKYLKEVIYDHTLAKAKEESVRLQKQYLCSPMVLSRSPTARKLCATPLGRLQIEEDERYKVDNDPTYELAAAMTMAENWSGEMYGSGMKSNIFVLPRIFMKRKRNPILQSESLKKFEIAEYSVPNPYAIKAILFHECCHAKYNFQGVEIGHDIVIDETKNRHLSHNVAQYINECEAYFAAFEKVKLLGDKHTAYHDVVFAFTSHVLREDPEPHSPYDLEWVAYEWGKLDRASKEIPLFDALLTLAERR